MVTIWIREADFGKFQRGLEVDCSLLKHGWFEVKMEVPLMNVRGVGEIRKVKFR
ncbi:hypothetical protein [Alicyclobacillus fodiniaquatilis]|uniref:Uncharacterized protein n=1 Tax=Alicyclobacillus fodiniaquatilis TaxID=1661150 RepID=A0ABW4JKQ2_9BACL